MLSFVFKDSTIQYEADQAGLQQPIATGVTASPVIAMNGHSTFIDTHGSTLSNDETMFTLNSETVTSQTNSGTEKPDSLFSSHGPSGITLTSVTINEETTPSESDVTENENDNDLSTTGYVDASTQPVTTPKKYPTENTALFTTEYPEITDEVYTHQSLNGTTDDYIEYTTEEPTTQSQNTSESNILNEDDARTSASIGAAAGLLALCGSVLTVCTCCYFTECLTNAIRARTKPKQKPKQSSEIGTKEDKLGEEKQKESEKEHSTVALADETRKSVPRTTWSKIDRRYHKRHRSLKYGKGKVGFIARTSSLDRTPMPVFSSSKMLGFSKVIKFD